jgi:hypothetical protein
MKTLPRILLCCLALSCARAEDFQGTSHKFEYEGEPVKYNDQTPTDAVAQLQQSQRCDLAAFILVLRGNFNQTGK